MVWQLTYAPQNEHPSNLAAMIAYSIAKKIGINAYVYDPVTVDQMEPVARITGLPEMQRKAIGHCLNMRAAAMRYAKEAGRAYNKINIIVAHLGGGISVSQHCKGKIIDTVNDEEGPFSPDRSVACPCFRLLRWLWTGAMTIKAS